MSPAPSSPSALQALNLGTTCLAPALLAALLARTPRLETLTIAVPTGGGSIRAAVAEGLAPVRGTLRVLRMGEGEGAPRIEGGVDLSGYGALREVNLPAGCVFATRMPEQGAGRERGTVVGLLPRGVESLQVSPALRCVRVTLSVFCFRF